MNFFERVERFLSQIISSLEQASAWLSRSADYTLVLLSKATDFIAHFLNIAVHTIADLLKKFLIAIIKTTGQLLRLLAMVLLLVFLWSYGEEVDAMTTGFIFGAVSWLLRICAVAGGIFVVASLLASLGKGSTMSATVETSIKAGKHNFGFFYFMDSLAILLVFVFTRWPGHRFHQGFLFSSSLSRIG